MITISGRSTAPKLTARTADSFGMTFHNDFWMVVGTAAPVIGLAHVVTIAQYERARSKAIDRAVSEAQTAGDAVADAVQMAFAYRSEGERLRALSADVEDMSQKTYEDLIAALDSLQSQGREVEDRLNESHRGLQFVTQSTESTNKRDRWFTAQTMLAAVGFLLTSFALINAMEALATGHDVLGLTPSTLFVAIGLLFLLLNGAIELGNHRALRRPQSKQRFERMQATLDKADAEIETWRATGTGQSVNDTEGDGEHPPPES
jgi:ABC-type multidrug transport system fused ATPase/permease subunit